MPNRIIKESICVSESINRLSWFQEVLFYRLMVNCDDYGRFDGRVAVIRNRLFPLKDGLAGVTVSKGLEALKQAGLIIPYEDSGRPYLYIPSWNEHQTIRAKKGKYPVPLHMKSSESMCKQMRLESESESESESEREVIAREEKLTFGMYENVFLTKAEHEALSKEFPDLDKRIRRLSGYMASTGKSYHNHCATLREWARRDEETAAPQEPESQWAKETLQRMMKGE